jgi:purine-binding chemotaxis protein CheW
MASTANSSPAAQGAGPRRSVLLFRLGGHACALPADAVAEVVPLPLLSRPPGLPDLLEGLLNLGGWAVPVVRLDRLLGLPPLTPGLYTPLLVLRRPAALALLVEAVQGLVSVPAADVRPGAPGHSCNDCLEGELTLAGRPVALLDPERLLLAKERRCLAALQAAEQERLRRLEEVRP